MIQSMPRPNLIYMNILMKLMKKTKMTKTMMKKVDRMMRITITKKKCRMIMKIVKGIHMLCMIDMKSTKKFIKKKKRTTMTRGCRRNMGKKMIQGRRSKKRTQKMGMIWRSIRMRLS
jgi:hypothetical protein